MELDPNLSSVEDSEEEEMDMDISSSSQDSEEDTDHEAEPVHPNNKTYKSQPREPLHYQRPSSKRKVKRRKWYGDIPFATAAAASSHPPANPLPQPQPRRSNSLGGTSHSYPLPSLRREDAGIFSSHHQLQSHPFTTFPTISRPPIIPKFTLSNLRADKHASSSTTSSFSPSLTHRAAEPNRLDTQFSSPSKTTSSSLSSSSPTSSSNLPPSTFRSCIKTRKESTSSQTKKQVLIKLENDVIVPPSSTYEEPQVIDSSTSFYRRSPPLDNEFFDMSSVPGDYHRYLSDEMEQTNGSPFDSMLKEEINSTESEHATKAINIGGSNDADDDNAETPKNTVKNPNGEKLTSSGKKKPMLHTAEDINAYFQTRMAARREEQRLGELINTPREVLYPTDSLHPRLGEKRESSSSLASETPSMGRNRSDLSDNRVFFLDDEIHRYQGSGPDRDDDGLMMRSYHKAPEKPSSNNNRKN